MTLNSDQLGKKGEAHFSEICSDAKLTCNPSTYDRTGWDFIVEFPYDPPGRESSLDKRPSPISCHVQVKTMWDSNDAFRMRVTSAERLAKEPKPAFVYVFKVNRKLEFAAAYLIHMLDDNLAAILKRLRLEEAKGAKAINEINKKTITFRASRSGQAPPTGEALRDALRGLCRPDPTSYMETKRQQLSSLGFDARRYEGKTTFTVGNSEELVDAFLGLRKVELTEFKTFESRFGIKLSLSDPDFARGVMHVQPNPADQCTITIREDALTPPAVFAGDIFAPAIPDLPREQFKFMVKSQLFRFLIDRQKLSVTVDEEMVNTASLRIEEWINFLRMLVAFAKQAGSITIQPTKLPAVSLPIAFDVNNNPGPDQYVQLMDVFERAQRLLKLAGATEPMAKFGGIAGFAGGIIALSNLFTDAANISPLSFQTELSEDVALPDKLDAIYANFMPIAGVTLAYYAVAELVPEPRADKIRWRSRSISPREIVVLHKFPEGYQEFVDRAKAKERIDNVMMAQAPGA
jgi:hypothetical protein